MVKQNPFSEDFDAGQDQVLIQRALIDPDNLVWDKEFSKHIKDYTATHLHATLRSSDRIYSRLYQEQPFKEDAAMGSIVEEILRDDNLKDILEL
ncbi:MAG: hypothetical protein AAFR36_27645 [Bacteroidota bacterium]